MTWRNALGHYHADTVVIIEIAERFLQDHFNHSQSDAERLLTEYFALHGDRIDESYVRHQHSWRIATEVEYCVHIGGSLGTLFQWRYDNDVTGTPSDALQYLRDNYWNRDR